MIAFSIRNKLVVGMGVLFLLAYGVYNVSKLPIDAVPDSTGNRVLGITSSPSLGAADIERLITVPIEQATRNIPGIIEQEWFPRFGLSLVTVVFNDETSVYRACQQISEKLVRLQGNSAFTGYTQIGSYDYHFSRNLSSPVLLLEKKGVTREVGVGDYRLLLHSASLMKNLLYH